MKMITSLYNRFSGTVHLLILIVFTFFILPLSAFSQVIVTETEEEVGGNEEVKILSDSAKTLLKAYQQQHFIPYINEQPLVTTWDEHHQPERFVLPEQ